MELLAKLLKKLSDVWVTVGYEPVAFSLLAKGQITKLSKITRSTLPSGSASRPALPALFSRSSALTKSAVEKKRTRRAC